MFLASGDNHPGARRATPPESGGVLPGAFPSFVASARLARGCAAKPLVATRFGALQKYRSGPARGGAYHPYCHF